MMMNEADVISNIRSSEGLLSTGTLIAQPPWVTDPAAQPPWVTDPAAEPERLEKEKRDSMEQSSSFGVGGDKSDPDVVQENGADTWKRIFKDVTDQYLKSAEPGNGSVLYDRGYRQSGHRNEIKTADWLCSTFGGDVRLLKETNSDGVLTADYVWNGKLWEYKETSSVKALDKRLQHAIHQIQSNPGGVIIKISDTLTVKDIERQIMSRVRRSGIEAADIMIVKGEKRSIEKIWRYKKYKK